MITVSSINNFENSVQSIKKLQKQVIAARERKLESKSKKGKQQARKMQDRFEKEYETVKNDMVKPSFWIDKESKEKLNSKVLDSYEKYKDQNILISKDILADVQRNLIKATYLSIGYKDPILKNISFELKNGDKLFIKGKNGVGKTTLIKSIIDSVIKSTLNNSYINVSNSPEIFDGKLVISEAIRLGIYEQEIDSKKMDETLSEAILNIHYNVRKDINDQEIRNLLAKYLFDPVSDFSVKVKNLSGGQKARLQIIKMNINNPNLLILDEPTNHLDLPSIEELEKFLITYKGAIIYVSHDSYFINVIGGNVLALDK